MLVLAVFIDFMDFFFEVLFQTLAAVDSNCQVFLNAEELCLFLFFSVVLVIT